MPWEINFPASGIGAKFQRAVVWGDSITAGSLDPYIRYLSAPAYGCHLAGLPIAKNAGVAGDTTAQMLARFATDVAPYAPTDVVIQGMTNDIKAGISADVAIANIMQMAERCRGIRATPYVLIPPPRGDEVFSQMAAANEKLAFVLAKNGVRYCHPWDSAIDPATGTWRAGYSGAIFVHPKLAFIQTPAEIIAAMLGARTVHHKPVANQLGVGLADNPMFLLDTDSDGTPDGWSKAASPSFTRTLEQLPGWMGNVVCDRADAVPSGTSVSQLYRDFDVDGGHVLLMRFRAKYTTDGSVKARLYCEPYAGATGLGRDYFAWEFDANFDTSFAKIIWLPANATKIRFLNSCSVISQPHTSEMLFGEFQLYDLTALGVI